MRTAIRLVAAAVALLVACKANPKGLDSIEEARGIHSRQPPCPVEYSFGNEARVMEGSTERNVIVALVATESGTYLEGYLECRATVELERAVAQHDDVHILANVLSDEQKGRVRDLLSHTGDGEYFPDI